ncbi:Putative sialic acid transporter [Anatilimnocola aggregata]|uniref:Sialic acid transporter n=1 Tax=Anatilimnocola aggregata TaxID=2528021 RepID=A0A517YLT8_9BACT|nr:MFS transporter [Anatilimnocola aggregata]QDU31197.1 Putative sialic acid transporter [Anatilimnocola aggregata]
MSQPGQPLNSSSGFSLTTVQWLICFIAAIGFAFDIYELLMLPLIVRDALLELGKIRPGTKEFTMWFSLLFYVPAVAGGIFGLLGGYLTDRLGRRRVLTWSILLYAFAAFAAGFSTSLPMLLFFRCLVFIGVCVEFVAAVAWLAELFDNPKQREGVLGFTQAFSSLGGLSVAMVSIIVASWAKNEAPSILFKSITLPALQLPAIALPSFLSFLGTIENPHAGWRYLLMSGLIPAIPLILIRPFLPESPAWAAKRESGKLRRPSIAELFSPALKRTTIVTTLMFTCSFGVAFGAIQQMPQIVPGLPETKEAIAKALEARFPAEKQEALKAKLAAEGKSEVDITKAVNLEIRKVAGPIEQSMASHATERQEVGGLVGRFLLAILILFVASRRTLLRMFLIPGMLLMPIIFGYAGTTSLHYLEYGIFVAGLLTVAQFSFWGNYLPLVYPVHLRGTGESFAANIGGRLIGTCFAGVTQWIAVYLPIDEPYPTKVAYTAAGVAFTLYVVNFIASFWLPEPGPESLHE